MDSPKVNMIVACDITGLIGLNGDLPWKCPEDMQYFKAVTLAHPLIMGRKTADSLPGGRPLKNRPANIVITRNPELVREGFIAAGSMEEAIEIAAQFEMPPFVIGGAQIYEMALDYIDKLFLTHVSNKLLGDVPVDRSQGAFFPLGKLDVTLLHNSIVIGPQWRAIHSQIGESHLATFYVLQKNR